MNRARESSEGGTPRESEARVHIYTPDLYFFSELYFFFNLGI